MSLDLLGVFGAGLLTFVTPCVLPLVPIYLAALVGGDLREVRGLQRGQLLARALLFSAGFILVFTLLGLTASSLGGFLLAHREVVQTAGAMLILIFGLKFLGLIQIPLLDRTVQADDRRWKTRFGWINALVMGVVFAAGWSPCAGPVLGSVLTYTASTTSDPWTGALYLATYGAGFALPLLLVALFARSGLGAVQRLGRLLPVFERAIGVLLVVVAGALAFDATTAADAATDAKEHQSGPCLVRGEQEPAMLVFTAENCPVCQRMQPVIDGIKQECHGKKVLIREVDLSGASGARIAKEHRLVGTPTFVFVDAAGEEVARLVGEQTETSLKQSLSALRGEPCPGLELFQPESQLTPPGEEDPSTGIACPTEP